ncbi:MAG: hypothetical protein NTY41_17660 [Proteobacteria bacterium]|nr:hypothetical protein [Pseudomonadota bacterium]
MRNDMTRLIVSSLWAVFMFGFDGIANAATPMVSLGQAHALALRSDGTVVSWGSDQFGKLGTGRSLATTTPALVPGLTGVKAIGSGIFHSLAIRLDGTVWAWGNNANGQLGDGTKTDRTRPVQVLGMDNAIMACGGDSYSMILKQDGTLWSWGGYPISPQSLAPAQVMGLTNITSVACGSAHILALRQDGTVWAWGINSLGALGLGTSAAEDPYRPQPVQVPGLANVVAIGGGGYSAALKQDGTVWEWGGEARNGLNYAGGTDRLSPVQTVGIAGAVKLGVGFWGGLTAFKADGTTWWSWDTGATPVAQNSVGSIERILPENFIVLLKSDGTVMQGQRFPSQPLATMAPLAGLSNIVALAGAFHFLALDANGNVWAWGSDSKGQLGFGAVMSSSIPNEISGLSNIAQVSAGYDHSLAVDLDGNVWAWGANGASGNGSRLGIGMISSQSAPVRLTSISNVRAAAAGGQHSLALKRDGTVWAWGANYAGQLGDGTYSSVVSPIQVLGLDNIVGISVANDHNLAVKQDGSVWAWGQNDHGQLGLGTVDAQFIVYLGPRPPNGRPSQIPGLTGVKSVVAAGYAESYAVKTDGTVMAWGSNWAGNMGDGSYTDQHTPLAVTGLTGVVEIAGGDSHALARKADGSVWGWGRDSSGELGLTPNTTQSTPAPISGVAGIRQIAAGQSVSGLLRQDGLVYMGGNNRAGQLGDGTLAQHRSFVLAVNPGTDGFLNLLSGTTANVPPELQVPFFVVSSGGITDKTATVSTTTKFKAAVAGKPGAVFVTARVPPGSLSTAQAAPAQRNTKRAQADTPASTVLVQLTSSGWQQVVNGQLIPYASGVLGDQLAAQTILSNTDTTDLKGAEFCLGYGASAAEMTAAGRMRTVATIPDPNATGAATLSCLLTLVPQGWSLLGNSLDQSFQVSALYGDATWVSAVWKWDAAQKHWQFYSPAMDTASLQSYASKNGYGVLSEIKPGEGYWVNAKAVATQGIRSGAAFNLTSTNLVSGWNLVATGNDVTPSAFNLSLSTTPPAAGSVPQNLTTLWAWDNPTRTWYFYAPSLEAQGSTALSDYTAGKGYLDFNAKSKTLGNGTGFWVDR